MKCPLCNFEQCEVLENISGKTIRRLYKRINVHVGHLIKASLKLYHCGFCDLKFFHPSITGDETFYNAMQKFNWYYLEEKDEYNFAKKHINPNDSVLEIGCGQGIFTDHLPPINYVGLEFSKEATKKVTKKNIRIENLSIEEYSRNKSEIHDVVCCFQVLEHIKDPYGFLYSSLKTLKKNGLLIIAVPSENSFLKYTQNFFLNMPPHHVTRWSDKALEHISKIFDINLLSIYHEKLQKIHETWYLNTLLSITIKNKFNIKNSKIVTTGIGNKIINACSSALSKYLLGNIPDELKPNGHTTVAVYKKQPVSHNHYNPSQKSI